MIDNYNRNITYMRVSVTELCNLRCRYCMPEEGIAKKAHEDMMTAEETIMAVKAAARLGIRKIRVTGGEPLVKRGIVKLCGAISHIIFFTSFPQWLTAECTCELYILRFGSVVGHFICDLCFSQFLTPVCPPIERSFAKLSERSLANPFLLV